MLTDDDVRLVIGAFLDIRTELRAIVSPLEEEDEPEGMTRRIREARRADQARYDDLTRRMKRRIEELRRDVQPPARRESS